MDELHYKRFYAVGDCYRFLFDAMRSIPDLKRARKKSLLPDDFMERIMLAVTEVNGCEICSYFHTGEALKKGVSPGEIKRLLAGDLEDAKEEEATALFFSQHYAEQHGRPDKEAWDRMISVYGEKTAYGILAAIRMIYMGNAYGIAAGAFLRRLKGNAVRKSSLGYELSVLLSFVFCLPVLVIHLVVASLFSQSKLSFSK